MYYIWDEKEHFSSKRTLLRSLCLIVGGLIPFLLGAIDEMDAIAILCIIFIVGGVIGLIIAMILRKDEKKQWKEASNEELKEQELF